MRRVFPIVLILITALTLALPAVAQEREKNNPVGIHTMFQDIMSPQVVDTHLTWVSYLTGDWGYVKAMIYPITPDMEGALDSWTYFINKSYELKIIPILRMDEPLGNASPPGEDGDYSEIAAAYARIAKDLIDANPTDKPLWFEIRNEPNNAIEWSNAPNPTEYATFYVAVAKALHAIGDPRIKVCNAALSPGGSYNNLEFIDEMCKVPGFTTSLDGWASHPYPGNMPPWVNLHDGTAPHYIGPIDTYLEELRHLEAGGVDISDLPVLLTEGAYSIGAAGGPWPATTEANRALYQTLAWRDYWMEWPEVLASCPYYLVHPWARTIEDNEWVVPGAKVEEDGRPSMAHDHYWAVSKLAKAYDDTGALSGVVTDEFGNPLHGAVVRIEATEQTGVANEVGFYIIGDVTPTQSNLTVMMDTYEGVTGFRTFQAGENSVWNPSLAVVGAYGSIRGRITDAETDEPLADAIIEVVRTSWQGRTGSDGNFTIQGVRPEIYRLLVRRTGYDPEWVEDVEVAPESTPDINVALNPNRLNNGGLEPLTGEARNIAPHWHVAGDIPHPWFQLDSTIKKFGLTSQRIDVEKTGDNNYIWQYSGYTDVVPGATYTLSAWVKTLGLEPGDYPGAQLELYFVTNDMDYTGSFTSEPITGGADWQHVVLEAIAPEGSGRVNSILRGSGVSGSAWFDDAVLEGPRPVFDEEE